MYFYTMSYEYTFFTFSILKLAHLPDTVTAVCTFKDMFTVSLQSLSPGQAKQTLFVENQMNDILSHFKNTLYTPKYDNDPRALELRNQLTDTLAKINQMNKPKL